MANFLIVVDADEGRRQAYLRSVALAGSPVAGLVRSECGSGVGAAMWWSRPGTPVSQAADDTGFAVVWGDALGGPADTFLGAAEVRRTWAPPGGRWADPAGIPPFDGYHATAVWDGAARRLIVGADLIGLFPLFYWADSQVLLVSSSPELFLSHPRFTREVDALGLAGLLLTDRAVGGRTLLRGVRRVAGGHLLIGEAGGVPVERAQYRFTTSSLHHGLEGPERIELIGSETARAIRRQTRPATRDAVLLSGGRDSRMVAGYLVELGQRPPALTFGRATDHDAICARRVAERLGLEQQLRDYPEQSYPLFARQVARWEHGANGFGSIYGWGMTAPLAALGDRVFTGYYLDALLSPPHALADAATCSFASVYASHIARGLGPATLTELLRHAGPGPGIAQLEEEIRATYLGYGDDDVTRAWCFYLYDRVRHFIGSIPWRLSFGAWPVLPALDRRWMHTMTAMPLAALTERRAQDAVLRGRFPQLNRTPIARPSDDTTPLEPGLLRRAAKALGARPAVARALARIRQRALPEQRYYYRINDFNGGGWRAIRREADAHRAKLHDFLDPAVLNRVLPAPDAELQFEDGLLSTSGLRTLVGVLLWAGDHV